MSASHPEVGTMTETRQSRERQSTPAPQEVASETIGDLGTPGDEADQAERLRLIMEAEAVHRGLTGDQGEDPFEGRPFPLEDVEEVLTIEDAGDSSDDPMHAGGLRAQPWVSAEESAMHVVDPQVPDEFSYLDEGTPQERADTDRDQFNGSPGDLTPEDETLLGVDPYEAEAPDGSTR